MKYTLKSLDSFDVPGRGRSFIVESPVEAERTHAAMKAALGPVVNIDGVDYEPIGFDMNMPATPVRIGEKIGILVTYNAQVHGRAERSEERPVEPLVGQQENET